MPSPSERTRERWRTEREREIRREQAARKVIVLFILALFGIAMILTFASPEPPAQRATTEDRP